MTIVYVIKESEDRTWSVYRGTDPTVTQLTAEGAMRVGRELGRITHTRLGASVNVFMATGTATVLLARYAKHALGPDSSEFSHE